MGEAWGPAGPTRLDGPAGVEWGPGARAGCGRTRAPNPETVRSRGGRQAVVTPSPAAPLRPGSARPRGWKGRKNKCPGFPMTCLPFFPEIPKLPKLHPGLIVGAALPPVRRSVNRFIFPTSLDAQSPPGRSYHLRLSTNQERRRQQISGSLKATPPVVARQPHLPLVLYVS